MKWNLAALLTVLVVEMHAAPPAEACGVKLTVKSSTPRKAVARTSNPSDVLLLGNPPRRLELDLVAAGHRVEVAPTASAAKRKSYAVVIADATLEDEARSSFSGAVVMVRSGDVVADTRSVEQQVARKPVRTEQARTVVAARSNRTPIAAGPSEPRRVVAASEPKDAPAVAEPPPPVEKVAVSVPKVSEPKVTEVTPPQEPKPGVVKTNPIREGAVAKANPIHEGTVAKANPIREGAVAKANSIHDEVYFSLGGSNLGNQAKALAKAVRWLTDSSDVQVVIEGHADPTGTPEGNLALAQKRAEWVRDYLVSAGIDQSRLEVISYGDTRLRYARTSPRNRRVAIVVK
jgi:outer membrane protein OmpA-like peptidoglycan-associated protein